MRSLAKSLAALSLAHAAGCSASGDDALFTGSGGASATSSTSTGGGTTTSGAGGEGGEWNLGGGGPGEGGGPPEDEVAEVFAQSASTLYRLDPLTKVVTAVGGFSGVNSSVIDIAIDKEGQMFAATFGGLYRVDKATAACTLIASGSYPNSLSFVPRGTLDPNVEVLVGYNGASYVRISTTTGVVTPIGVLSGGYVSSGDIVSVIGGGTYLTVKSATCADCIVEVNPVTGDLVKLIGPLGHSDVFGVAFWGGSAYGFNNGGELFQVDLTNGATTSIDPGLDGLSFWGAGSTTAAPLTVPE
jgi:hypothetical protein